MIDNKYTRKKESVYEMLVCTNHEDFFRNYSQLVTNIYISFRSISDSKSVWFFVNRHFQRYTWYVNACKAHVQRSHAPIFAGMESDPFTFVLFWLSVSATLLHPSPSFWSSLSLHSARQILYYPRFMRFISPNYTEYFSMW